MESRNGTKWHLRPINTFSVLLVCPKWSGLCPEPNWELTVLPDPLACCCLSKNLFPALSLRPRISQFPPKQISGYARGFREQSKLLQRVPLQRKGGKTLAQCVILPMHYMTVDTWKQTSHQQTAPSTSEGEYHTALKNWIIIIIKASPQN